MAAKWLIMTKTAENHTLWQGRTHLCCPDKGIFPPIQGHSNYSPPQPFFAKRFVIFQKSDRIVLTNFWLNFVAISVRTFCQISQKLRFFGNFPSLKIVQPGFFWQNMKKSRFFSLLPANSRCLQSAVRNTSLILCELSGDPLRAAFKFSLCLMYQKSGTSNVPLRVLA